MLLISWLDVIDIYIYAIVIRKKKKTKKKKIINMARGARGKGPPGVR